MPVYAVRFSARSYERLRISPYFGALLICLFILWGGAARADISLSVDLKDQDKLSDIAKVVAHADSPDGIDKVEFKVDSESPVALVSVPYVFTWDTIASADGPHTLLVTAYDSKGASKAVTFTVTVDNQISLGAAALVKSGFAALAAQDIDGAYRFARRAAKAAPGSVVAARLTAAVYAAKQDWERAIAAFEKVGDLDSDPAALLDLAGYRVRRALLPENAPNFLSEMDSIGELRRKAGDLIVGKVTAANAPKGIETEQNVLAIGDAQVIAGRYLDAANTYSRTALGSASVAATVNRYALATILDGRPDEVVTLLHDRLEAGRGDTVTRILYGLALVRCQKFEEALNVMKPTLQEPSTASLVVSAFAHVGVGDHKTATADALAAVSAAPNSPEAQYALAVASLDPEQSDEALRKTLALASFQPGPIMTFGMNPLYRVTGDKRAIIASAAEVALKIDSNNINALLTKAVLAFQAGKTAEFAALLKDLLRRDELRKRAVGRSADISLVEAMYWDARGDDHRMLECLDFAHRLDPARCTFATLPKPDALITYLNRRLHYRADPFLTLGLLYPPTAQ